jgi:anthranilate/para-aminobenzoate synthase component I
MGYLGFNKMSQWNILIRTAIRTHRELTLHVGSGIVADSDPESEFQETQDKAAGWLRALEGLPQSTRPIHPTTQAVAKYLNP